VRYGILAVSPVLLLLAPFALVDAQAVARELFAYSGVADFGWTGVWRAGRWWLTGSLARSDARFWPVAAMVSKGLFLGAWVLVVATARDRPKALAARRACLTVVLAFLTLYGLLSAQYLLWAVPLGLLAIGRHATAYSLAASAGLAGFYLFLAPGTLWPAALPPAAALWAGRLWAGGAAATLAAAALWLRATLRVEENGRRAATAAT
jgi:hypothetical protein